MDLEKYLYQKLTSLERETALLKARLKELEERLAALEENVISTEAP